MYQAFLPPVGALVKLEIKIKSKEVLFNIKVPIVIILLALFMHTVKGLHRLRVAFTFVIIRMEPIIPGFKRSILLTIIWQYLIAGFKPIVVCLELYRKCHVLSFTNLRHISTTPSFREIVYSEVPVSEFTNHSGFVFILPRFTPYKRYK